MQILGWWCSGYDEKDEAVLCALVLAASPEDAEKAVKKDWPEAYKWRFVDQREDDFVPGNRFVLEPWMQKRVDGCECPPGKLTLINRVRLWLRGRRKADG